MAQFPDFHEGTSLRYLRATVFFPCGVVGGWEGIGLLRLRSQSLLIFFLRIVAPLLTPQGEGPLSSRELGDHTADLPDTCFPHGPHTSQDHGECTQQETA